MYINEEYLIKCEFIKKERKKIFLFVEILNEKEEICLRADSLFIVAKILNDKIFLKAKF